jgi:hypothetical protein
MSFAWQLVRIARWPADRVGGQPLALPFLARNTVLLYHSCRGKAKITNRLGHYFS